MHRFLAPLTALAFAANPTVLFAANYAAVPISRVPASRIIAEDISWACGTETCHGSADYGRPIILCQGLAERTGRLASFIANGRALSATELDRCNSRARGASPLARNN